MKYKKCPRCEINYIPETEDYCEICQQELKGQLSIDDFDEFNEIDFEEEGICPRCKINYVAEGEKYCHQCLIDMESEKGKRLAEIEEHDEWAQAEPQDPDAQIIEDTLEDLDEPVLAEEEELSLDELAEEEGWNEEEEEEEDEDEMFEGPDDDFEELDIDIDSVELDDEEEEEEEDEDKE